MRTSELRIGNIVKYKYDSEDFHVVQAITEEDVDLKGIVTFDYAQWDELEPIPITEERLLKFGFELDTTYVGKVFVDRNGSGLKFNLDSKSVNIGNSANVLCEWVHKFQNLYHALTGKELEDHN